MSFTLYDISELSCKWTLTYTQYLSCLEKKTVFFQHKWLSWPGLLGINPLGAWPGVMMKETHFDGIIVHRQQLGNGI